MNFNSSQDRGGHVPACLGVSPSSIPPACLQYLGDDSPWGTQHWAVRGRLGAFGPGAHLEETCTSTRIILRVQQVSAVHTIAWCYWGKDRTARRSDPGARTQAHFWWQHQTHKSLHWAYTLHVTRNRFPTSMSEPCS
jgi:hypothetical protein